MPQPWGQVLWGTLDGRVDSKERKYGKFNKYAGSNSNVHNANGSGSPREGHDHADDYASKDVVLGSSSSWEGKKEPRFGFEKKGGERERIRRRKKKDEQGKERRKKIKFEREPRSGFAEREYMVVEISVRSDHLFFLNYGDLRICYKRGKGKQLEIEISAQIQLTNISVFLTGFHMLRHSRGSITKLLKLDHSYAYATDGWNLQIK
ncbi:hypothetical protein SLEP1_g22793 [Rubroshorea leprosula]|uniref:Uncharacterized protein n=1 Tax=Rubroshorea leprosula TaxID=152421 RepID=A0AAV5JMB5_9ROSI|nr:hypothetical protein SLEP1_g22793 [Rubroshorea leprosula]